MKYFQCSILLVCLFFISGLATTDKCITLNPIGNYRTGIFAEGGSEIVAFDPLSKRLFSVNGAEHTVDVLNLSDPSNPVLLFSIDLTPYGKAANSVDVFYGMLAVAIENNNKQQNGTLAVFSTFGNCPLIKQFEIGALPDMVTFSPNGKFILVANEGEPNDDYSIDPEGSVSIIDLRWGIWWAKVRTVAFTKFNDEKDELIAKGIRIFGPNSTVAQDFEPEYITVSDDSRTAWVTLQENNAIAVINIEKAEVEKLLPLGYKNHMDPKNKLDASNEDGMINIANWPVYGMYLPDAIASYKVWYKTYIITANEGDSRDYSGFSEEERVADVVLDPTAFPDAAELQKEENLGRLKITNTLGDIDGDGDYDKLYSYGARSFAIWTDDGHLVYESGSLFEEITAEYYPEDFNSSDEENNSFDDRSDDKGPETEGVAVGTIFGKTYAFIGLERIGGIMVFDVTNPYLPVFIEYVNMRDFSGDPENDTAGDLSPEGIKFVPAWQSPTHKPLLLVGYEISGSVGVFQIDIVRKESLAEVDDYKIKFTCFPNPFNPETTISYNLPKDMEVNLTVYNVLGQKIAELVNTLQVAGDHQVKFDGSGLASGMYLYILQAGENRIVNKFILQK
jgi:2',3'-cyclic-nucleotide 2'-phosphodiesterase/3'-nucleotidase/5'-nucleotidase